MMAICQIERPSAQSATGRLRFSLRTDLVGGVPECDRPGDGGLPGAVLHCPNLADLLPGQEALSRPHLPE